MENINTKKQKEKIPEEKPLTGKEKREQNLIHWKKGQSGNPKGRPKGVKNWSTVVQQLLSDEEFYAKLLDGTKNRPKFLSELPTNNPATAIVAVMIAKSIAGDKQAAEWLRKTGFGDKFMHEFEEGFFEKTKLTIEIVEPKHAQEIEENIEPTIE